MRRIGKLLALFVLFPGQAAGQVEVVLFDRDNDAEGGRDLTSAVLALEKSRDALLQAREAVDTALVEVDHALSKLRTAPPRRAAVSEPSRARLKPDESASESARRPGFFLSRALSDRVEVARKAFARWAEASAPVMEGLRDMACRLHAERGLGVGPENQPSATAARETPENQPSATAARETNGGEALQKPVFALSRESEIPRARPAPSPLADAADLHDATHPEARVERPPSVPSAGAVDLATERNPGREIALPGPVALPPLEPAPGLPVLPTVETAAPGAELTPALAPGEDKP